MSADSANAKETIDSAWIIAVSRQAGATSSTARRAASMRPAPAMMPRRIANTRCIESEKPDTSMSGVMTLMNRLRRKSRPPSTPSVHRMAIEGPATAMSVSDRRRKKR
jgi:hypothetical protein